MAQTWLRQTEGLSVPVECGEHVDSQGVKTMRLTVAGCTALLSEEDAASLGGYLLGTTNNAPDPEAERPETVPQGGGI